MKMLKTFLLICALPALAAPPELPSFVPKPKPKHTSGSKVGALERTAYTQVILKAAKGTRWAWAYTFGPPQKTSFRFYGRAKMNDPETLLGTNSVPVWDQYFTNGRMQVITCVAEDFDMRLLSNGKPK